MQTEMRSARKLRIGDRVISSHGTPLTVTSTRLQGAGAGVVSVGYAEIPGRASYRPGDSVSVLVARQAG